MTLFILSVTVVIVVSAACSLSEAALYAVRMPYVRQLAQNGSRAGALLVRFKHNMEQPITAILILNTVANTAGAAVAGAQARFLFGEASVLWFSALFTLTVLFASEIMPKIAGVAYSRAIARLIASPLNVIIMAMYPLVITSQKLSRVFQGSQRQLVAPEEEVQQFADMSAEEGSILPLEAELVKNVLKLNEVTARQIMTPRTVVFKVASNLTVKDVAAEAPKWPNARVPVYEADDPGKWFGMVLRTDVLAALARDDFNLPLKDLAKPLQFVPDVIPGHTLLGEFLKRRRHLFGVVDEYGDVAGIVSLEDVLESVIGAEIVDETDLIVDMQEAARQRSQYLQQSKRPNV